MTAKPLRNERPPLKPLQPWTQPPDTFKYKVKTGDTWLTLGAQNHHQFGEHTIIWLNFRLSPLDHFYTDQVNWYLREYVGCRNSLDGGRNWAFTDDADPGKFPDPRFRYYIAHHIAHAWIPKRCYGEGYYPFSWGVAPKIDTIWFSEGFAQYAAIVAIARDEDQRRLLLDRRFRSVLREAPPELRRVPLRELSLRASTNYTGDFRIAQNVFSRGGLMAEEMDTQIRTQTHDGKSLRDALRALLAWSAQTHRAFRVEELPAVFYEATGVDTKAILEKWIKPQESLGAR